MSDAGTILLAAFVVGLLSLDHTAVGQFMLSQPLVGGWALGLAVGRPAEGLAAGTVFQVLCLRELPVGASIPPDGEMAGLAGTALYLTLPRSPGWSEGAALGLAVLLFFPLAWLGRSAEVFVRRANGRWTGAVSARISEGRFGAAQAAAAGGIGLFFLKPFLITLAVLWSVPLLLPPAAPGAALPRALETLGRIVPFAALGAFAADRGGRRPWVAALGVVAGLLLCWRLA